MSRNPTAIDLFCGAGGLSEGLRQAGFSVVGAVEVDSLACHTYRLNHTRVKLWERDVRRVSGASMMRALNLRRGDLDLLAACPPCQGFSIMRTKNGSHTNRDSRNDLIFEVLRMVRAMKPKCVMLENVPGLARNGRYVAFSKGLESLGYRIKSAVLNAKDYGVPQRRRRLVVPGSRLAEPECAPEAAASCTVRDFIETLTPPERSRDPLHNYSVLRSKKVVDLIRRIPPNGGSRMALGQGEQLPCHQRLEGFWDVYGRMAWDRPAPTITGGCINPSKGRFLHPCANRAITLREAALLQTFPKKYCFPLDKGRYPVALLIGNALPPEFIRRHATALRQKALSTDRLSSHVARATEQRDK